MEKFRKEGLIKGHITVKNAILDGISLKVKKAGEINKIWGDLHLQIRTQRFL